MKQKSEGSKKEVHIVEDDMEAQKMWDVFLIADAEEKDMSWKKSLPNDAQNSGNADTHSTGNRQRLAESEKKEGAEERRLDEGHFGHDEVIDVFQGQDELRDSNHDQTLIECGVPDTACRRTLVGEETLAGIEDHLRGKGLKVRRARVSSEFRFGNNGTLESHEVALLPAEIAGKRLVIRAAILPNQGRTTPLLLSKEF